MLTMNTQTESTPAWARSGTALKDVESVEELLHQAGLNWRVTKVPLVTDDHHYTKVPKRYAIVRQDTPDDAGAVLGVVGRAYAPVDNATAMEFFDKLVRRAGATFTRAGALAGGERVFAFARLPIPTEVTPGDTVEKTLLLVSSHNGSRALTICVSPIRVACQNQISLAIRRGWGVTIKHTAGGANLHAVEMDKIVDRIHRRYTRAAEVMKQLAATKIDKWQFEQFVRTLLPATPQDLESRPGLRAKRETLSYLFEHGRGAELSRGTLWGAVNAAVECQDYQYATRRRGNSIQSAILGDGARLKERAWEIATQMAKVNLN